VWREQKISRHIAGRQRYPEAVGLLVGLTVPGTAEKDARLGDFVYINERLRQKQERHRDEPLLRVEKMKI